jgi:hypothetical protein
MTVKPTIAVDEGAVRAFVALLHERAAAALNGAHEQGVLHLCRLRPDDKTMRSQSFVIGDVENMVAAAVMNAQAGFNVYVELRTVRPGRPTERGRIGATRGVFAFGIDRDGDTNKAGCALNGDASAVVETSPGNAQEWLFLDRALSVAEAVPIGAAIRATTGADSCTGVITQPLRVPGTPNYPNAKKRERGRVTVPTSIKAVTNKVWTKDEIIAAFPPPPLKQSRHIVRKSASKRKAKSRKPPTLVVRKVSRKATASMDRSAMFQSCVAVAVESGMQPDELEQLMREHPEGCASKYVTDGSDRLKAEIARSWEKAEQQRAQDEQSAVKPDPNADGAALLEDVAAFLTHFVVYPSEHAHVAHTLWIAHTHLMDVWDSTPRIAFLSPERETGKTRALEVTELMVPRPVMAFNASASFLFRRVADEAGRPTILYDEVDCVFRDGADKHEDVRALINAGHRKGAVAGRCVIRGNTVDTEEMPAYCAVVLAGIDYLPDTIMSRSVVIRMRRRAPNEAVEPFRRRLQEPQGHALRDRLASWAAGIADRIVMPEMPEGVQDRAADVWEALLAVADITGGKWPDAARCSAVALVAALRERQAESLGTRLLADLRTIFKDYELMPTKRILLKLRKLPESPWADIKGKALEDRGLATRLRPYEIKSKNVRVDGKIVKGYAKTDFYDAWLRYLPAFSPEALQAQQPLQGEGSEA